MRKKGILAALAAAALAVAPVLSGSGVHAAGSTVIHGITFATGTNNCTGPIVPVYGSSALKSFILKAAADYCNNTSANPTHIDVEYASGGDSCPGVDWAADYNDNNELGVSDVYAPGCAGSFARSSAKIVDSQVSVNAVESIAQCPGASTPQGGSPNAPASATQCAGNGSGAAGSDTFPAPNNESVQAAQLLWNGTDSDYGQIGGTSGAAPTLQQRSPGSGTRATWCFNLYGPGLDGSCANSSAAGTAATTGVELGDVCGNPYAAGGPAAPADPNGTIGYSSRGGVTVDPRQPSGGLLPVAGCGIVQLNGQDGYNRNCNPAGTTASSPYSGINSESGAPTCNGDLQVATGSYPTWGYEHLDYNSSGATSAASAFVTYVNTNATAQTDFRTYGFMQNCQMLQTRATDAGPYSASPGASC